MVQFALPCPSRDNTKETAAANANCTAGASLPRVMASHQRNAGREQTSPWGIKGGDPGLPTHT